MLIEEIERMKFFNLLLIQNLETTIFYPSKISSNFHHFSFFLTQPWTVPHKSAYLFQNPGKKYPISTYSNRYFARERVTRDILFTTSLKLAKISFYLFNLRHTRFHQSFNALRFIHTSTEPMMLHPA